MADDVDAAGDVSEVFGAATTDVTNSVIRKGLEGSARKWVSADCACSIK